MNERLLQFIWQHQYFNKHQLSTDEGEPLHILHPGAFNRNQGPDFLNASIKIQQTTWAGHVELHVRSSDWNKHGHTSDANYKNVVLHVVWENDGSIAQASTLSLRERVPKLMLEKYQQLMQESLKYSCSSFLPALTQIGWLSWKERLVAERLERRSARIMQWLEQSKQHWEEVLWWMLAGNFGVKVNTEVFEAMARSIPISLLGRHKHQIHQLEALLLGQANLLGGQFQEDYPIMLQKEYRYLRKKYGLKTHRLLPHFLRMRPANFPTVRLAQLAMLVNQSTHLFSRIREMKQVQEVKSLLNVTANDYWHYHYQFDETTAFRPKHLGNQMVDNIIINTVVPILFAYGLFVQQEAIREKAIHWLQQTGAEQNAITRKWTAAAIANHTAFDSQALIELSNNYCQQQRCLDCAVGNSILRPNK